jgi:integral membrane protein (TIGR01906 family)
MRRSHAHAPWPIGLAFVLGAAVVISLLGPLALFNPWFTGALQERHGVATRLGTSPGEVERVTGVVLSDLFTSGDFSVELDGLPLLDARERSHMADVSRLVRLLLAVLVGGALAVVAALALLRREQRRVGRLLMSASAVVGGVALVLAVAFAVAFDAAFLAFHAILFPPDTYLFAPDSQLIRLFPQGFWFDASLAAGASILVAAVLVGAAGLWLWRRRRLANGSNAGSTANHRQPRS